jgi:miniconductance mechanosensitive channel
MSIKEFLNEYQIVEQALYVLGILLIAYISYFITRKYILRGIAKLIERSKSRFDDIFFSDTLLQRVAYITPLIVIWNLIEIIPALSQEVTNIIKQICTGLFALILLFVASAFLNSLNHVYNQSEFGKRKPIKGYIQVFKIILYIFGTIVIISILMKKDPLVILGGFGALTAVLILVFRDTILSFVASLQISSNDLVRIGDWIEVPAFGADGDVMDIALHTIKVQNWDKTITVIPTHKLIDVSFKNWRGMQQTGGRRIKRALYIDQSSVKFCSADMLQRFEKIRLLADYLKQKREEISAYNKKHGIDDSEIINRRHLTNIGTFRIYVENYLKGHEKIHHGLTCMVRQLAPTEHGLPIELYVFTNDTAWVNYEKIQADIFDHLLAIIPEFDLKIFQNPTGSDFSTIGKRDF